MQTLSMGFADAAQDRVTRSSTRADIQALRGIAVLVVLLYHLQIGPFRAGYLGVDIFFVISGYLITTLIAKSLDRGDFSLARFYGRRAKRLLPAAYTVILLTTLAAPWFLDQQEMNDLSQQVVGAIAFVANFVFWQQADYFGGRSDLKPLLHTWSLSVEEQYYMLLPAMLLLVRRVRWMRAIVLLLLASLALCVIGVAFKPVASFYLLPTRAWELLIGSAGALYVLRNQDARPAERLHAIRWLYIPSILGLVVLPAVTLPGPHPGLAAFLICVATLIVILRNHPVINSALPTRWLAWVGDRSYSLYLVHWPIIALLKNAWAGSESELPVALAGTALVLALVLAYLLHRFVEDPMHKADINFSRNRLLQVGMASFALIAVTPLAIELTRSQTDYRELRRVNFGLGLACEYKTAFIPKSECQTSAAPNLMVWGDSFAMHLVPGLLAEWRSGGVIQATQSACGPLMGLAPRPRSSIDDGTGVVYDREWSARCIEFNRAVIDFLRQSESINTVVISSLFSAYVGPKSYNVLASGSGMSDSPASVRQALRALKQTASELRAIGKKVVLIAPPPTAPFNIGGCLERMSTGRVTFGAPDGCQIAQAEYQRRRADVIQLLAGAEKEGIPVIRFEQYLCDGSVCKTSLDGTMIYRDSGHLTHGGSVLLAQSMKMGRLIAQQAR